MKKYCNYSWLFLKLSRVSELAHKTDNLKKIGQYAPFMKALNEKFTKLLLNRSYRQYYPLIFSAQGPDN